MLPHRFLASLRDRGGANPFLALLSGFRKPVLQAIVVASGLRILDTVTGRVATGRGNSLPPYQARHTSA